jgi:hypothetical protein
VLDCINWFVDEDARYLSSFRTGEVWRIPMTGAAGQATLKRPDGVSQVIPVHEGRAVVLGEQVGFYELSSGAPPGSAQAEGPHDAQDGGTMSFAANLLDASESAIAPQEKLVVDGGESAAVAGFRVGVRREIWIYLLLAAVLLTALEWATYHRRVTV